MLWRWLFTSSINCSVQASVEYVVEGEGGVVTGEAGVGGGVVDPVVVTGAEVVSVLAGVSLPE